MRQGIFQQFTFISVFSRHQLKQLSNRLSQLCCVFFWFAFIFVCS